MNTDYVHFSLNEPFYSEDSQSCGYGNRIFRGSVYLIDELRFESFALKSLVAWTYFTQASSCRFFEIEKNYKYLHMLIYSIMKGNYLQRYFAKYLPRLADADKGEDTVNSVNQEFIFNVIGKLNTCSKR